jgi:hypothetical protein
MDYWAICVLRVTEELSASDNSRAVLSPLIAPATKRAGGCPVFNHGNLCPPGLPHKCAGRFPD